MKDPKHESVKTNTHLVEVVEIVVGAVVLLRGHGGGVLVVVCELEPAIVAPAEVGIVAVVRVETERAFSRGEKS